MLASKNLSPLRKITIVLALVFSVFVIFFYGRILPLVTNFTEQNVKTYDGVIEPNQIFIIEMAIWFFVLAAICLSLFLLFGLDIKLKNLFLENLKDKKVNRHFFKDKLTTKEKHTKYIFWISIIASLIIHLKFLLFGEPEIEGFDENFFTFPFLISSIILFISVFKIKKLPIDRYNKKITKTLLSIMAIVLLFLFLEEVSYGQHIFKWESTGVFKESNFQSETNLHNFVNPLYRFIYPTVGMGLLVFLMLFWFYLKKPKAYWFTLLLPHPSLIVLVFFLAASSFIGHNESFEQILSIFVLLYAYRVWVCIKHPKLSNLKLE